MEERYKEQRRRIPHARKGRAINEWEIGKGE